MDRHTVNKSDVELVIKDTRKPVRGMGEFGERKVIMEFENTDLSDRGNQFHYCPHCGYDRVEVKKVANSEMVTPYEYSCMNPNCDWYSSEDLPEEFK